MLRLNRLRKYLGESLWFVPTLLLLGFVLLALAAAYLDRNVLDAPDAFSLYGGSAGGARTILATIATSMLSMAVLVFSITLLVLQLAGSQLTPRVIPLFLQNLSSKIAMGVFLGTFAYALTGLWFVRVPSETSAVFVPVLTVSLAVAAVGLSLLTFLNYINRVSQSIRLENIASKIAHQTLESLEDSSDFTTRDPEHGPPPAQYTGEAAEVFETKPTELISAPRSGLVIGIDTEACHDWAREQDAYVEVLVPLGRFVVEGAPLVKTAGAHDDADFPVSDAVSLGSKRSVALDPEYGVRELVDIALRALSSGVNEPGMAVIALDRIHEVLHRVGHSDISGGVCTDSQGVPRVFVPRLTWTGWVSLGLREVLDHGKDSVQICARVTEMLEDLMGSLPTDRHDVLQRYLAEVRQFPGSGRPYMKWTGKPTLRG